MHNMLERNNLNDKTIINFKNTVPIFNTFFLTLSQRGCYELDLSELKFSLKKSLLCGEAPLT